jgi:hypothetical protein
MPTKQETEKIAETLYTQLKDNPVDYSSVGGEAQEPSPQRMSPSQRRMQRANARQDPGKMQQGFTSTQSGTQNIGQFSTPSEEMNVKDLLSEESEKKSKKGDDFDLGMGEDLENSQSANEGSGPESIEDIGEVNLDENSESCPNCKKPTDKVIYCPKCGFAFCKSCAKLVLGNEVTCPKCGNKTKV